MRRLENLAARLLDPSYQEELLGDLYELRARRAERQGARAARARFARDLATACLLVSRARGLSWRQAAPAIVGLATAAALLVRGLGSAAATRYTVTAQDPRGRFTLEIRGTRVLGATLDGVAVPPDRLRQDGQRLVIVGGSGARDLELRIKPRGGIEWAARRAGNPASP